MSINFKIVNDVVVWQFGDDEFFTIDSYPKFESFVNQSKENLPNLISGIKTNLIDFANKELTDMEKGSFDMINETMAFTRLMQLTAQHLWFYNLNEKNRIRAEFQPPPPGEDF